jgi:GNAT superfamily N-acetyltransferase
MNELAPSTPRRRSGGMSPVLHPVGAVLHAALRGEYPPDDGVVDVVEPWSPGIEAVVSFTAHTIVATMLPAPALRAAGIDAYEGAFSAGVVSVLTGPDGTADSLDVVLLAAGTGWTRLPERPGLAGHPRVRHARRWRQNVSVHGDERGLVTVSRGLGGVAEVSFEVAPEFRGHGVGRDLLTEACGLVAAGEPVVALVAPGNARSLRAALAAGFTPVGGAQLIRPGRTGSARSA